MLGRSANGDLYMRRPLHLGDARTKMAHLRIHPAPQEKSIMSADPLPRFDDSPAAWRGPDMAERPERWT